MTTITQPRRQAGLRLKKTGHSLLKLVHLFFNACWIGGGLGMILLLTIGSKLGEVQHITVAIQVLDLGVVVPSAIGSLLTGLGFSLFTQWGFVKHRWILVKYAINLIPVIAGPILQAPWLVRMDEIARSLTPGATLPAEFGQVHDLFLAFTVAQWGLLLVAIYLSVFKPALRLKRGSSRPGAAPASPNA